MKTSRVAQINKSKHNLINSVSRSCHRCFDASGQRQSSSLLKCKATTSAPPQQAVTATPTLVTLDSKPASQLNDICSLESAADMQALTAASTLRTMCFHMGKNPFDSMHPPEDSDSDDAPSLPQCEDYFTVCMKDQLDRLESRVNGEDAWSIATVLPYLLVIERGSLVPHGPYRDLLLPQQLRLGSAQVVGSLDINVCNRVPDQQLAGTQPNVQAMDEQQRRKPHRAYISNVCVDPRFRGQGIATLMMEQVEQIVAQKGLEHVYLHVSVTNEAAIQLYTKIGYVEESRESYNQARLRGRGANALMYKQLGV